MPATRPRSDQGLLTDQMGFNGLVITDASHMLGMASAMRREDYVPGAIAAGCDMFLFFNDVEEDFRFMLDGYQRGVISEERMQDALRRVLGLKAKLNLPQKKAGGALLKSEKELEVIGCAEHLCMRAEAADLGITLVKNTYDQLPIRPETHRRIRLYFLQGEVGGIMASGAKTLETIVAELEKRGSRSRSRRQQAIERPRRFNTARKWTQPWFSPTWWDTVQNTTTAFAGRPP